MKKVVATFLIFLFVLILIDRAFTHFFLDNIFSKTLSGESGGSLNYLIKAKKDSDFLVLGSSRAKHQINPNLLSNIYAGNGYNAGINGVGTIVYNSILLEILVNNKVIPKLVLLQTDAYLFSENENTSIENEIIPLYPFIEQSTLLMNYTNYSERIKLLIHSYRYNGKFLNILFNYSKRNAVSDNDGYIGLQAQMDTSVVPIKPNTSHMIKKFSAAKINALKNAVRICKQNNIKLTVLLLPFYNNENFNVETNKEFIELLKENGVVNIIDFSDINRIPQLKSASLWKDGLHLNDKGSTILTKVLNNSL